MKNKEVIKSCSICGKRFDPKYSGSFRFWRNMSWNLCGDLACTQKTDNIIIKTLGSGNFPKIQE